MDNKKMIVYKESFIFKIEKFFKNIFGKKEQSQNIQVEQEIKQEKVIKEEQQKTLSLKDLKVDAIGIDKTEKSSEFSGKINRDLKKLSKMLVEDKTENKIENKIENNNSESINKTYFEKVLEEIPEKYRKDFAELHELAKQGKFEEFDDLFEKDEPKYRKHMNAYEALKRDEWLTIIRESQGENEKQEYFKDLPKSIYNEIVRGLKGVMNLRDGGYERHQLEQSIGESANLEEIIDDFVKYWEKYNLCEEKNKSNEFKEGLKSNISLEKQNESSKIFQNKQSLEKTDEQSKKGEIRE